MKPELNVPNAVTALRVILTPLFIWLMMSGDGVFVQLSAGIFLLAAISDWYDGWYARRHNVITKFGMFFDPLADKVFVGAALVAFAFLNLLPMWMVLVVVGRDVLVTALRIFGENRNRTIVTSTLAKWKTAGQFMFLWYVVIVFTMNRIEWMHNLIAPSTFASMLSRDALHIPMILLTILSVITAGQYLIVNRHALPFVGKGVANSPSQ